DARKQADLLDVVARMESASGQKANRLLALAWADQKRNLDVALEAVEADLKIRQDVYTYDALAWVRHQRGEYEAARGASRQALRFGTPEPLFHFHAGMIAHALGDTAGAKTHLERALSLNPKFSVRHAPVVAATLRKLG
ncbi:MAG: tetratricopeptide repeat protein, partial [Bryobacteraceae bacterium]